ncbi:hypothetical protein EV356DRAFT_579738 [Viridothelium virens]|uniref:Lytic polysaccharide monooxygenase n=1 Tax=Viridothelium virens TaxID=1048519 RepID=A0A6A6GZX3_VIRVR|nr:hypothetical protein EV356DRAFT_579738 [Viridothelium virens]
MKSIASYALILATAAQVVVGIVINGRPMGHGPVIHPTNEPEDDPVWNSVGISSSSRTKLKIIDHVTSMPGKSSDLMGPMGSKSYQCGIFGAQYGQSMSRVQLGYQEVSNLLSQSSAIPASNGTASFPAPFAPGYIAQSTPNDAPDDCHGMNAQLMMWPIKRTSSADDHSEDEESVFKPHDPAGRYRLIVAHNAATGKLPVCGMVFFRTSHQFNGSPAWCTTQ